jgi:hypothetical protein
MIILMMFGTPIVLTLFDTFVSLLLTPFGGSGIGQKVSQADINSIENNIYNPFSTQSGSFYMVGQTANINILGSSLLSQLAALKNQTTIFQAIIADPNNSGTNFYGVDSSYLQDLQKDLTSAITYLSSGFSADQASLGSAINSLKVGEYISQDQISSVGTVIDNARQLHVDI